MRPIIRSKNHSCAPLRNCDFPCRVIIRFGSITPTSQITSRRDYLELNKPDGCKISGDKIKMKKCFIDAGVKTAEYFTLNRTFSESDVQNYFNEFGTIIAKHKHSSKGNGIFLLENYDDFNNFHIILLFSL